MPGDGSSIGAFAQASRYYATPHLNLVGFHLFVHEMREGLQLLKFGVGIRILSIQMIAIIEHADDSLLAIFLPLRTWVQTRQ